MHTDEYEISLSRELDVCRGYIRKIKRFLDRMEKRHNCKTEQAIADFQGGKTADRDGELAAWAEQYESLKRWQERKAEYEVLFHAMKK